MNVRLIAYYLPQYHPIPENDKWWGKGFTEWTNVTKAKPLYPGHRQPNLPSDLGFYDLRLSEAREAQADLAKAYGIEGFCYYHYWFGGKRLLERPFNDVLISGKPDYPFCLCWANETWSGIWHGAPNRILMEQSYPGKKDHEAHFYSLLNAFTDSRYMTVDGKPIFIVYEPNKIPEVKKTTDYWRELASRNNVKDLYLIGVASEPWEPSLHGFDAIAPRNLHLADNYENRAILKIKTRIRRVLGYPEQIYSYKKAIKHLLSENSEVLNVHPTVVPNWDNSPRSGLSSLILHDSTPELFKVHLSEAVKKVMHKPHDYRMVFIKSWNEWAEGNHLEPNLQYGRKYLEAIKEIVEMEKRKKS
jgi:lipopolysaccharide biosynthesis protein